MYLVYPSTLCITISLDFSWDNCNTQKKLEKRVLQYFFLAGGGGVGVGGGGVDKVHCGLCESSEFLGFLMPVILYTTCTHNRDNTLLFFTNDVMLLTFINLSRSSAPFFTFGSGSAASWTVNNNNHFENLHIRFKKDNSIISDHCKVLGGEWKYSEQN